MPASPDKADLLAAELGRRVAGEVRFDRGSRALYATDASNYRQVPIGVVVPRTIEDVVASVEACGSHGVPVLARGGGTSLAGQCCNVARAEAERHHLTFGPDPSTHDHNTLGGMLGNNSCGVHSVMAGRMADNVRSLELLTYDGLRMRVGATSEEELAAVIAGGGRRGEIYGRMRALRDVHADEIRARYPRIPRRVSGYNLDELLPENGFHVARALVGSEGTL